MRRVEKFQPAEFDERHVAPRQLQFERRAVMRGAEQHRLRFQRRARLAVFQHAGRDVARLIRLLAGRDQLRDRAGAAIGPEVLGPALGTEADHRV